MDLLSVLINVLILGLIVSVAIWAINLLPIQPPFKNIAIAVVAIIVLIWCLRLLGVVTIPLARAHNLELYSAQCCHGTDKGGDCEPLPFESVSETKDGYRIDFTSSAQGVVHETVPYGAPNVFDSKDGRWHVCLRRQSYPARIRCLYRTVNG